MAVCRHRLGGSMGLEEWESLMDGEGRCKECGAIMDEQRNLRAQVARLEGELATAQALLDCGKDTDCADVIEIQEQCKKHYEVYVEQEIAEALADKKGYAAALDRLQKRFNEVWGEKAVMAAALKEERKTLPPAEWEPYDAWGDYSAYPLADGSTSGVDDSNSGDVHSHGIATGEWSVGKALDRILERSE